MYTIKDKVNAALGKSTGFLLSVNSISRNLKLFWEKMELIIKSKLFKYTNRSNLLLTLLGNDENIKFIGCLLRGI